MAMAKGISSAYLPFGAVAMNEEIYEGLRGARVSAFTSSLLCGCDQGNGDLPEREHS